MNQQEIDQRLDEINKLKGKLLDIEEVNRKLKASHSQSVCNMNKYQKQIDAEIVAIRYYDNKVQINTQEYFDLSDRLNKLIKE